MTPLPLPVTESAAQPRPALLLLQGPDSDPAPSVAQLTHRQEPFRLIRAHTAMEGLELLLRQSIQLVLVQPPLPDLEATSFCRLLKNHSHLAHIPVVTMVEPDSWDDQRPAQSHSPWLMTDVDGLLTTEITPDALTRSLQEHLRCYQNLYGLPGTPAITQQRGTQTCGELPLYLANQASDSLFQLQTLEALRDLANQGNLLTHFYGLLFNLLEKLSRFHAVGVYLHPPAQEAGQWMFHTPEHEVLPPQQLEWLYTQGCELLKGPAQMQPFDLSAVTWDTFYSASQSQEGDQDPAGQPKHPPHPSNTGTLRLVRAEEGDQFFGAFLLWSRAESAASASSLPLHKLERELSHLIQFRYYKALQQLRTELDNATQLMSYTALLDQLEREYKRAQRYELSLSLVAIELSGLDRLTAQYGSELISSVSKLVSYHAREHFRATDWLARTGPAHFVFLLPETDAQAAMAPCQRFLEQVRKVPLILHGHQIPLNFEIGLASYLPTETTSGWDLFQQARAQIAVPLSPTP